MVYELLYTMRYKYGERTCDFGRHFSFFFLGGGGGTNHFTRARWIWDSYSQLGVTRLVGYLPSHIQLSLVSTNEETSTVLCSVVKHVGSGRARKKCRGEQEMYPSVFPYFFCALPLPKCFTTELSTVETSLFVF